MLNSTHTKVELKILINRSYKDVNKKCFLQDLQHGLKNNGNFSYLIDKFKQILNHHAHLKKSKLRGNTGQHINKTFRKRNNEKIQS